LKEKGRRRKSKEPKQGRTAQHWKRNKILTRNKKERGERKNGDCRGKKRELSRGIKGEWVKGRSAPEEN